MTSGIFISYRRLDSKSDARSICQRLEKTFGKGKVFIDVDSIRPGDDFQSVLKNDLEKGNTVVVVIGPRWLELLRSSSKPSDSETSDDYVYLEVASALQRKLPIFPVLVDGATMPEPKDLPDYLKPLAFRQAFSVRHESFPRDMLGLEQELRRFVPTRGTWIRWKPIDALPVGRSWRSLGAYICAARTRASAALSIAAAWALSRP
jgi:hypothetical protein